MQSLICSEDEANKLRLILERGIRSLSTPDVAMKACRNERRLAKEIGASGEAGGMDGEGGGADDSQQEPPQGKA